jgi:hypothetical protein
MSIDTIKRKIEQERRLTRVELVNLSLIPPLLELIGFEWDENSDLISLNPKKLIQLVQTYKLDDPDNHDGPEGVFGRFIRYEKLGLDDAVRFVMYCGVPKDPDEYRWNELDYGQKTRLVEELIKNAMNVQGIKKFKQLIS